MKIHHEDDRVQLWHGDAIEVLASLPDASVDSVVCDPPYGLEFMGKDWDRFDGGQQARWEGRKTTAERMDRDGMGAESMANRLTARPSFGKDSRGRKCIKCGHYKFSGTPCRCAEPEWEIRTGTPPHMRAFQDWCTEWATECLRVLKPGGHLLAFGGTRTWHRLACAVEDAGFEVRDSLAWMYGSGFPKSLDVSKAIDKAAGAEREVIGDHPYAARGGMSSGMHSRAEQAALGYRPEGDDYPSALGRGPLTAPATPDAERWQGWGTALKPAFEPIVLARKPLAGTVAGNVLEHGTGALNIDGCRVGTDEDLSGGGNNGPGNFLMGGYMTLADLRAGAERNEVTPDGKNRARAVLARVEALHNRRVSNERGGRWPANVVLDESQAAALDEQSGESVSKAGGVSGTHFSAGEPGTPTPDRPRGGHNDSGGASRFFYTAKADAAERPKVPKKALRLRSDLTPEQVDHVRARLAEAGVQVD